MTRKQDDQQTEWPRRVLIRQTTEAAADHLDEDYDMDSDGGDTLMNEVGESMHTIEICSWADIPRNYEPILDDRADIASYEAYLAHLALFRNQTKL